MNTDISKGIDSPSGNCHKHTWGPTESYTDKDGNVTYFQRCLYCIATRFVWI